MGGQIALHTALRHPARVRSLALLDSSPAFGLDGTDPEAWKRLRLDPLDAGETPASIAEPVLRSIMAPGADEAAVAAAVASMSRISAEGLRAAIECLPSHDVRDRLGEIAVPTLVLVGELDDRDAALLRRGARRRHPGHASADHPGRRSHLEPGSARGREHRPAGASRRQGRDGMTEWRWLEVFSRQLRACALSPGEIVAVLSESASRPELVETSRIAAQMLGGRVYDVVVPTPANTGPVALRSTGASQALARQPRAPSPPWRRPSS